MKHAAIASFCSVLTVFVAVFLVSAASSIGTDNSALGISLFIAGVAALVACVVVLVWALPVHFVLRKFKSQSFFLYLVAAIVPSFVFVYVFKPFGHHPSADLLVQALNCSLVGVLGAASFWYFGVYRPTHNNSLKRTP